MLLRLALYVFMSLGVAGLAAIGWIGLNPKPAAQVQVVAPPVAPLRHVSVLSAARAIRAGSLIKPEDIASADMLQDAAAGVPDDTVANRAALLGAMVRHSLLPGQPLRADDVLHPGDHGFLAAVLSPGMRAVSVGVDAVSGTAGLIWPGDHVDLILTQALDDATLPAGRRIAGETVLADLRVIAIDQELVEGGAARPDQTARTVTLEVTPAQAERVAVATRLGRLSLVVRAVGAEPAQQEAKPEETTWGGDVSGALRAGRGDRSGNAMRVYTGVAKSEEYRF